VTKSRGILPPRRKWLDWECEFLRLHYADSRTDDLATVLKRTVGQVYQKAAQLGLTKSEAYLATDNACRIQRGKQHPSMIATRFKAGQVSWNKGLKGVVGVQEACRATQFKKGRPAHEARNYVPIGSHRVSKDGYLQRKGTDDPSIVPARRWTAVHHLVWEEVNGPVPAGHVVVFKPGCKTTDLESITADCCECVTRQELMRRNSYHTNYPPEVARLIQLRGAINRQINKRAKHEQEHQ
jgi:hypothetical protein